METYPLSFRVSCVKEEAKRKSVLSNPNPHAQALETIVKAQKMNDDVIERKREDIKKGIGDVLISLIIQAEMQQTTLEYCLERAYQEFKEED